MSTTLHPQARAFLDLIAVTKAPPIQTQSVAMARAMYTRMSQVTQAPSNPALRVTEARAQGRDGELPVRFYRDQGTPAAASPAIMFFHGGGWVLGGLDDYDNFCRDLAAASGCVVASLAYRLAPEHPFPAGLDDCYAATQWAASRAAELGIDPRRIAVAGDSAGGALATAMCRLARDRGGPMLRYQALIYPSTDMTMSSRSQAELAEGYLLTLEAQRWFGSHYVPAGVDLRDPLLSPLFAQDLAGLPPALVVTAGFDPLRDEGKAYADRLAAAGVAVEHVDYADMIHGFITMTGILDTARAAIRHLGSAIGRALAAVER